MVLLRLKFQPPPASLKLTEFVLDFVRFLGVKVSVKENEGPTEKNILVVREFLLQRQVFIKAKILIYLIKDFISSKFKTRLSFFSRNWKYRVYC